MYLTQVGCNLATTAESTLIDILTQACYLHEEPFI